MSITNPENNTLQVSLEDWPRCSVCDMPVEDFYVKEMPSGISIVANCHGDTERVEITESIWDSVKDGQISIKAAFNKEDTQCLG